MGTTPHLGFPELSQGQANPDVTVNTNLRLNQALHNGAIDRTNTPPGSPAEQDCYLIGTAPTGVWTGKANLIAVYIGGEWKYIPGNDDNGTQIAMGADQEGLKIYVRDEDVVYTWRAVASSPATFTWSALSYTASEIANVPAGNVAAANVQDAINELDNEKPTHVVSEHRLSLTTDVPVTNTDVSGAATVYSVPFIGNRIPLFDGTTWRAYAQAQLSIALDSDSGHTNYHQSGKGFDVFYFDDSGTKRIGTGPAWSSDTSRGTGAGTTEITRVNGIPVNANTITLRFGNAAGNTVSVAAQRATYLGSFYCTANGQTTDSEAFRYLWNMYNRRERSMKRVETANEWNYTTATTRQANGNTANQLNYMVGLAEDAVTAEVNTNVYNSDAGGVLFMVGVGVNSTSTVSGVHPMRQNLAANRRSAANAHYRGIPGAGRNFLSWNEYSGAGLGTTTWGGTHGNAALYESGIVGTMWG